MTLIPESAILCYESAFKVTLSNLIELFSRNIQITPFTFKTIRGETMNKKSVLWSVMSLLILASLVLAACAPAADIGDFESCHSVYMYPGTGHPE